MTETRWFLVKLAMACLYCLAKCGAFRTQLQAFLATAPAEMAVKSTKVLNNEEVTSQQVLQLRSLVSFAEDVIRFTL